MTPKLIAFDIDSTLLNSKGEILPSTLEALDYLKANGHFVTLASGRSYTLAKEVISSFHFENYVLTNGAVGFVQHKLIFEKKLAKKELLRFDAFCKEKEIAAIYQSPLETSRSLPFKSEELKIAMASFGQEVPPYLENFLLENEMNQVVAFYGKELDDAFKKEQFTDFDFIRWHPFGVDILPKNNSKAHGLLKMAEMVGIKKEDTFAFGDGLNDREMLKEMGTGIAMGNASDEVKAFSDYQTTSNDEDGIYHALKHFKLI